MGDDRDKQRIQRIRNAWPDFKISLQELQNPSSDLVINFMERFMIDLNINLDHERRWSLNTIPPGDQEAFHDVLYLILLYKHVVQFFIDTNIGNTNKFLQKLNFIWLLRPKPKPTQMLFAYVDHYLDFKNNFQINLDQIYSSKQAITQKKNNVLKLLNSVKEVENNAAIKHGTMNRLKEECKKEMKSALVTLQGLRAEDNELTTKIEYANVTYEITEKKVQELLKRRNELQNKIQSIKDKQMLTAKKHKLQELLKTKTETHENLVANLRKTATSISQYEKLIQHNIFTDVNDLSSLYTKNYDTELKDKRKEVNNSVSSYKDGNIKIKNTQTDMKSKEEEMKKIEKQWNIQKNAFQLQQQDNEKQIDELKREFEKRTQKKNDIDNQISKTDDNINRKDDRIQHLQQLWLKSYQRVLVSNKKLHTTFQGALKQKNTKNIKRSI